MRALRIFGLLFVLTACAETERCPDGQVFDEDGTCVPIEDVVDAGSRDAGSDAG